MLILLFHISILIIITVIFHNDKTFSASSYLFINNKEAMFIIGFWNL